MPEYIERDEAIRTAIKVCGSITQFDAVEIADAMEKIPAADVAEVKHGEWIKKPHISKEYKQCPVCKYDFSRLEPGNYCPNCGAKMGKKEGAEK